VANDQRPNDKQIPETDSGEPPRIGTDEWVAQAASRRRQAHGFSGWLVTRWESVPLGWRYGLVLSFLILVPLITNTQAVLDLLGISNNAFIVRTATRFLVFALLAIGLNVVVGYAGLLDLGYVAFYGIAGYLYAYLSSDFVRIGSLGIDGLHVPALVSIPLIIIITAMVGWLIGTISLRLSGDYLAIVTLGFGQVFVQLVLTSTRVRVPWQDRPVNFTRGPNGINRLDDLTIFGYTFESTIQYYYLLLVLLALVYVGVRHLNYSRIGRAWRSVREDELAAEVMGAPTGRLKILAFVIGAGIAALAGSVDAAWQGNVVPVPRYSVLTLINLYAMVVLGGIGSLTGVVIGAFTFTVLPEVLRSSAVAGVIFYGAGLLGLLFLLKPFKRFLFVLAGTIASGAILKLLVTTLFPGVHAGLPEPGSLLNQAVRSWLLIPTNFEVVGNIVTILCALVLLLTILAKRRPGLYYPLLGLAIYMLTFAWETRLALEPSATRILIVGATLVVLMIVRPQGLLGKPEVRVV
jgi:branched-chain amino acid transport system permease protein